MIIFGPTWKIFRPPGCVGLATALLINLYYGEGWNNQLMINQKHAVKTKRNVRQLWYVTSHVCTTAAHFLHYPVYKAAFILFLSLESVPVAMVRAPSGTGTKWTIVVRDRNLLRTTSLTFFWPLNLRDWDPLTYFWESLMTSSLTRR